MKIIFDNEEQKKLFIDIMESNQICPSDMKLVDRCGFPMCRMCWEEALRMEVCHEDHI